MVFFVYSFFLFYFFFFFFQAEDGIRDIGVTGVQTCALPICFDALEFTSATDGSMRAVSKLKVFADGVDVGVAEAGTRFSRSEERRVGKECRSRGSPYH